MGKKILTLNIGSANVALAEYETGSKGTLKLVNYGLSPLAAPLDGGNAETILSPALLDIVRTTGIRPGRVLLSISGQLAFPRIAAIPAGSGEERFEQLVKYEVEQNIPFPIDELVCDRQIVGETEAGDQSVLIVAAKVDQIESITAAVASAGFTPELVDVAPLALVNVLCRARPTGECAILLDIGAKTSSLAILESDRIYNRSIPVAGQVLTKEIATALGCDLDQAERVKLERGYVSLGGVTEDEDEVADRASKACRAVLARLNAEISRSINFYRSQQGGGVPTKLYLAGGSSLLPQLDQFFAEALGVEVEYLNPLEILSVGPRVDAAALEADALILAPTAGLALRGTEAARYAINLLPPSLVEDRAERARIPFVIVAGVLLVAALALVRQAVTQDRRAIDEKAEQVSVQERALRSVDASVTKAREAFERQEAKASEIGRLVASRTKALRRLVAVGKAVEGRPGMWIDRWDASGVTVRQWNDKTSLAGSGKTAAESIAGAIGGNDTNVIDAASVKITSMSEFGRHADVKQFTVEFKKK